VIIKKRRRSRYRTAGTNYRHEASRGLSATAELLVFDARVVNVWDSLPGYVVHVNFLQLFESVLYKFWW